MERAEAEVAWTANVVVPAREDGAVAGQIVRVADEAVVVVGGGGGAEAGMGAGVVVSGVPMMIVVVEGGHGHNEGG